MLCLLTWVSFTRQTFGRSAEVKSARFQVYTSPAAANASSLRELQLSIEQMHIEVQHLRAKRPHPSVISCEHPRRMVTCVWNSKSPEKHEIAVILGSQQCVRSCFSDLHRLISPAWFVNVCIVLYRSKIKGRGWMYCIWCVSDREGKRMLTLLVRGSTQLLDSVLPPTVASHP